LARMDKSLAKTTPFTMKNKLSINRTNLNFFVIVISFIIYQYFILRNREVGWAGY